MTEIMESHSDLVSMEESGVLATFGIATPEIVREVLQQNLGGTEVSPFDLDRVRVPAGGSTTWEVPGLGQPDAMREFEGIIVSWNESRRYYAGAYQPGAKAPPDCVSDDLVVGIGVPGGDCKSCPFNQWGSAIGPDGQPTRGKACGQYRMLFVNRPGNILPMVVVIPPSSLGVARKYFLRLASRSIPYFGVVTKFRLEAGDPVATVGFGLVDILSPQDRKKVGEYATKVAPIFSRTRLIDEDL